MLPELHKSPFNLLPVWSFRVLFDIQSAKPMCCGLYTDIVSQPACGGFEHCSRYFVILPFFIWVKYRNTTYLVISIMHYTFSYNDGCNECVCSESGADFCTMMACYNHAKPYCTSCKTGYRLNADTKQCEECALPRCQDPCGPFNAMSALGQVVCNGYPDAYCQGTVDCDGCFATYFDGNGAEIECVMTSTSDLTGISLILFH